MIQSNKCIEKKYDVIVIGGGMSGICAAIASARHGAKTAIINDRPVYGGNASSEIRVQISGASCHWQKKNAAETGILMELQLENKKINDSFNYALWDGLLWSTVEKQENLEGYLNCVVYDAVADNSQIISISAYQSTTESSFQFSADIFIDATGNGSVGKFVGAEYMFGHESKDLYNEEHAPKISDMQTMGDSIYFVAHDAGHAVRFTKPDWAYTFTDEDFKNRPHGDMTVYDSEGKVLKKFDNNSGYWWLELGGDWENQISSSEKIRWELYKSALGIWDHLKNGGKHGAENFELDWVGIVAGKRETRRLTGDYILNENDILSNRIFDDGVAYGGFWIDDHPAGGFMDKEKKPSDSIHYPGFYSIPYRCYYSRNIENLMMAGRNISASKMAMSSSRVMATCSVGGQAAGTAAALCKKYGLTPRELGREKINELQQILLKDDCYIPGIENSDKDNIACNAIVFASSSKTDCPPENVIRGITRNTEGEKHCWMSDGIGPNGESITLKLDKARKVSEVRLVFDPNLSDERFITVSKSFKDRQKLGVAETLVKDYTIKLLSKGNVIKEKKLTDNYQRLNICKFDPVLADEITINFMETNGSSDVSVFEIRIY